MSMWEIDELLKGSILLVQNSDLSDAKKSHLIWNLESLPERHEMDAGGFAKIETNDSSFYEVLDPFVLGEMVAKVADEAGQFQYIYDWSAFLLNFSSEYFSEYYVWNELKASVLINIKLLYHKHDLTSYDAKHATLAVHENGHTYFSEEQNKLINWFLKK